MIATPRSARKWVKSHAGDFFRGGYTYSRDVFNTGAMGALAPAIFGHFSTEGKNCGS